MTDTKGDTATGTIFTSPNDEYQYFCESIKHTIELMTTVTTNLATGFKQQQKKQESNA